MDQRYTVSWYHKGQPGYEEGYRQALFVRDEVFTKEQGFLVDIDETDDVAHHLVISTEEGPVATARLYPHDQRTLRIGRVAVLREYRGTGLGVKLLQELERKAGELGAGRTFLDAQVRAEGFYHRCGYRTISDFYYDEYCPHVDMEKELDHEE